MKCTVFVRLLIGSALVSSCMSTWAGEDATLGFAAAIGGEGTEFGNGIAVDAAGSVYTTGGFGSTSDFDPGEGTFELSPQNDSIDAFIVKHDAAGNFVWARAIGGDETDSGTSIAVDAGGNVYVTGFFRDTVDFDPGPEEFELSSEDDSADLFVLKLNVQGNFVWAKTFGGEETDSGRALALDSHGDIIVTGFFRKTVDFDPGDETFELTSKEFSDIFILKLDGQGNFVYAIAIGGAGNDSGNGIAVDADGNAYITGEFRDTIDFDPGPGLAELTNQGSADMFVLKLDEKGDFFYATAIGDADFDIGNGIDVDTDGNAYVTGFFRGTVDFDTGPGTSELTSILDFGMFILKLDEMGDFVYVKEIEGTSYESGNCIDWYDGDVYTTGWFEGAGDFDPGPAEFKLSSEGGSDVFVLKLDAMGDFVYAKTFGGTDYDTGYGIVVTANGGVHTTGSFLETVDFDPGSGVSEITSMGGEDAFVLQLLQLAVDPGGSGCGAIPGARTNGSAGDVLLILAIALALVFRRGRTQAART